MTTPTLKQQLETLVVTLMQAAQTGNQKLVALATQEYEQFVESVDLIHSIKPEEEDG